MPTTTLQAPPGISSIHAPGGHYQVGDDSLVAVETRDVPVLLGAGFTFPQETAESTYSGAHSHQIVAPDLTLTPDAGSDDGGNPKYLAAIMGNLFGGALSKAANYLAGVIGAFSITGPKLSTYPTGAVLAQITDGVTEADGAVVAYVDGDGDVTKANAAFKAMSNNSTAGSGFDYGLDLTSPGHDGFNPLAILKADLRLSNNVCVLQKAGAPGSGDGAGFAGPGSLCIDTSGHDAYINAGTKTTPSWKKFTRAS
jgi:hypothetical protein